VDGFAKGIRAPLAGVRFLAGHPNLLRWFAVPVLINIVVYCAGAYLFFTRLASLLHWIFGQPETWYMKAAFYSVGTIIAGVFAVFLVFTFTAVGLIVAGPFLDVLSRKIDETRFGFDPAGAGSSVIRGIWVIAAAQVKKLILFLLIQALLLLAWLIPGIGQIVGAPLQLAVTFFSLAWEFWDFPLDRRGMDYRAKKEFMRANKMAALSFGAVCGMYMLVPLLNFLMIPASVAGATILVSDLLGESSPRDPSMGQTRPRV